MKQHRHLIFDEDDEMVTEGTTLYMHSAQRSITAHPLVQDFLFGKGEAMVPKHWHALINAKPGNLERILGESHSIYSSDNVYHIWNIEYRGRLFSLCSSPRGGTHIRASFEDNDQKFAEIAILLVRWLTWRIEKQWRRDHPDEP
jgi:hypothetical protein